MWTVAGVSGHCLWSGEGGGWHVFHRGALGWKGLTHRRQGAAGSPRGGFAKKYMDARGWQGPGDGAKEGQNVSEYVRICPGYVQISRECEGPRGPHQTWYGTNIMSFQNDIHRAWQNIWRKVQEDPQFKGGHDSQDKPPNHFKPIRSSISISIHPGVDRIQHWNINIRKSVENIKQIPTCLSLICLTSLRQFISNHPNWEFQDPKMEVLYHIRPYFVGIFPYIGHWQISRMILPRWFEIRRWCAAPITVTWACWRCGPRRVATGSSEDTWRRCLEGPLSMKMKVAGLGQEMAVCQNQ